MSASATLAASSRAGSSDVAGLEVVKWLAFAAMLCDHVDLILFDRSLAALHAIGYFAAPAFAACFGLGLRHSRDAAAAGLRLAPAAAVAQVAWIFAGRGDIANILCTFALCGIVASLRTWPGRAVGMVALVALTPIIEGGAFLAAVVLGAAWLPDRLRWWNLATSAPWALIAGSPAALLGLLAPHLARWVPIGLQRRPGALAWLYPGHLLLLVALAPIARP